MSYWTEEQPKVLTTRANTFRYYEKADALAVSLPDFPDRKTGVMRIGKTISINLEALTENPEVIDSLIEILSKAKPIQD